MKTILIVDDEAALRRILNAACTQSGYRTIVCKNGEEATSRITDADLLLTDWEMPPGMDGIKLAKIAKEKRPDLPVILITGKPWELPEEVPADAVFEKPFKLEKLERMINDLLV